MPKSIIREIDESNPGFTLSTNFAVLVPGYLKPANDTDDLRQEAEHDGIYIKDSKTYILNSTKQFDYYIGKFGGKFENVPPVVEEVPNASDKTGMDKWQRHLQTKDFRNLDTKAFNYYIGDEITDPEDPDYHQDKKLVKTFIYKVQPEQGDPVTIESTYKFSIVSEDDLFDDLHTIPNPAVEGEFITETVHPYFMIKKGNEGTDKNSTDHIGNQMAYELLKLGYTVYFKVLNTSSSAVDQLSKSDFWEPLKQKSVYRIRYLTTGGCYSPLVASQVQEIASFNNKVNIDSADTYGLEMGRGDVIALLDIDENDNGIKNASTKSKLLEAFGTAAASLATVVNANKYTAIFAPRVLYNFGYPEEDYPYSNDQLFPASFHYLACAAMAQQRYAEWYAVAGYKRGICNLPIRSTTYTFGDIDINTLAPRVENNYIKAGMPAINLILSERGNYYLWGNRTAEGIKSDKEGLIFSHFLNIRQLCCTLKQVLYEATRQFTFDPNSDLLWINFVNAIRPTLETMKADQGIAGYKISRVATNKKAVLVAKIRIVPIEAIEDFDISVYLEDSLSGIIVDADEEEAE